MSHTVVELPENWTDTRETLLEGMVFQLKYLGVTLVEQPKGEELSAAAVKRIVATVRSLWKLHLISQNAQRGLP
ncbi:low density lipoprotein receptor adapter protein 1b isoform X1 [Tachysurus ichikawai]